MSIQRDERGQAMVEFALVGLVFLMLTAGLVDVGRGFYAYLQLSDGARIAARWAAVQGGTCGDARTPVQTTAPDWCNGLTAGSATPFWMQTGNIPKQGNAACPTNYNASWPNYYIASTAPASTIVGALSGRLETSGSSSSTPLGNWLGGLDPQQLRVCIQISSDAYLATRTPPWQPAQGDWVTVYVYYPFHAVSNLFPQATEMDLIASSRYMVE